MVHHMLSEAHSVSVTSKDERVRARVIIAEGRICNYEGTTRTDRTEDAGNTNTRKHANWEVSLRGLDLRVSSVRNEL